METLLHLWRDLYRSSRCTTLMVLAILLSAAPPTARARRYPYGVQGPQVIHGSVSFGHFGNTTTITASDRSVINYRSFDIARSEIVRFIQPGPTASVLNRITSARPTNIDGTLLANGRVFFVNPAGVYIGEDALINVNQLVASGLNISNADFINGQMNFTDGDGTVRNQGDITAEKVHLIGKHVVNSGDISCPEGHVILAAGDRIFLRELGSEVMVEIDPSPEPTPSESPTATESEPGVLNQGNIEVGGGQITLGAGDMYAQAVSNVGSMSASVQTDRAGRIDMTARAGQISNTGSIEAKSQNGTGGTVHAKADEVMNSGTIDVTGTEGGSVVLEAIRRMGQFGSIHADGTETNGGDISLSAGEAVALSSESLTTANAGPNGDGGDVTVYSPDTALFWSNARIEAQGGTDSGNGGFVEVSGRKHIEIHGQVDASAPTGTAGTFLIDPTDITVVDDIEYPYESEQENSKSKDAWKFVPNNDKNEITDDLIEDLLSSGTSVTLDTASQYNAPGGGDIVVAAPIDPSPETPLDSEVTLTFNAADDIEIRPDTGIDASGLGNKLDVTLRANHGSDSGDDPQPKYGDVEIYAEVKTNGGDFTSSGVGFDNRGGQIETAGGAINIIHTADVVVDNISASDGSVTITSAGSIGEAIQDEAVDIIGGVVDLTASGGDIGPLEITASGRLNARTSIDGSDIIINCPEQPPSPDDPAGPGSLTIGELSSAGAVDLEADGGIVVDGGDGVEISAKTSISLHAGASGEGDLSFQSEATVSGKNIVLRAGDGLDCEALGLTGISLIVCEMDDSMGGGGTLSKIDLDDVEVTGGIESLTIWQDASIENTPRADQFGLEGTSGIELILQSDDGSVASSTAHIWESTTANALKGITLEGSGTIAAKGLKSRTGNISVHSTTGNLVVTGKIDAAWRNDPEYLGNDSTVNDTIGVLLWWGNLPGGGVKLLADKGSVQFTTDCDDCVIQGYSDELGASRIGVELPGEGARAGIVISSKEDLSLPSNLELFVYGEYRAGTGDGEVVDDRESVGFLSGPSGYEGAGDPIDVSVYLRSTDGDVAVDSNAWLYRKGTMVVDAKDSISLGPGFVESWKTGVIKGLEVVSRMTNSLSEAARYDRLPGAAELQYGEIPNWIEDAASQYIGKGDTSMKNPAQYVLRGGSPGVVLASTEVSVPDILRVPGGRNADRVMAAAGVPPLTEERWKPATEEKPWTAILSPFIDPVIKESVQKDKEEQKRSASATQDEEQGTRVPVRVVRNGQVLSLKEGMALKEGDVVTTRMDTAGFIRFGEDSHVIMEPNTCVAISTSDANSPEKKCQEILVEFGKVWYWAVGEHPGRFFVIRTTNATLNMSGTVGPIEHSPDGGPTVYGPWIDGPAFISLDGMSDSNLPKQHVIKVVEGVALQPMLVSEEEFRFTLNDVLSLLKEWAVPLAHAYEHRPMIELNWKRLGG